MKRERVTFLCSRKAGFAEDLRMNGSNKWNANNDLWTQVKTGRVLSMMRWHIIVCAWRLLLLLMISPSLSIRAWKMSIWQ